MQVQLTTDKQNSNQAFGRIYKFSGRANIGDELYRILKEKGAIPPRDFIGGELDFKDTVHLATGEDAFAPPRMMPISNGLSMLAAKVKAAGENVVEFVLDGRKSLEEQIDISLKSIGKDGKQEIEILKK